MKYNFFEALAIVVGTERQVRSINKYGVKNLWATYDDGQRLLFYTSLPTSDGWWPTIKQQKQKIWEVEPVEVFVYGACEEDHRSLIYHIRPDFVSGFHKSTNCTGLDVGHLNLFPIRKSKKLKLVFVKENE